MEKIYKRMSNKTVRNYTEPLLRKFDTNLSLKVFGLLIQKTEARTLLRLRDEMDTQLEAAIGGKIEWESFDLKK